MSAKTAFWYGLVVALVMVGLAVAKPLSTNDEPEGENGGGGKTVMLPEQTKETIVTESSQPAAGQTEDFAAVSTDPTVETARTEANTAAGVPQQTEDASTAGTTGTAAGTTGTAAGTTGTAAGTLPTEQQPEPVAVTGSDQQESTAQPPPPPPPGQQGQRPKPHYTGDAQAAKVGPTVPFYLEFFQPFQSFQPFPQAGGAERPQQPSRHQPFSAVIDPFDPFENPMRSPPFSDLVEAYTNEFRKMLESFDHMQQSMPQMHSVDNVPSGSNKPVSKTTTKTEIIDGHVVQINETTYSNGDANHKSFYHFKEIQVLPEGTNKKIANEKVTSMTKDDSESEKVELNEIRRDPIETFGDAPAPFNQLNIQTKVE